MGAGILGDAPDVEPPEPSMPSLPPIQGAQPTAPPAALASPSQAQTPGAGATPPLVPASAGRSIEQGTGKGEIATPDVKPEYDAKKLAKAQTTLDLLNAMKPASRTDYIDWWQKQHGDIDDKYDQLKSQLGARPSDDEPQTKKEKFAALLEFGLHLMKNSAPASTNQGAVLSGTLSDSVDSMNQAHQAGIAQRQGTYDTQANAIEAARDAEQKGIGTPAAAQKQQAALDKDRAGELKDTSTAFKNVSSATTERASALGAPTYAVGPGGVIHSIVRDADGKAHAEAVTGIDGKPFQGRVLGRTTGSGIDKSAQDTASIRNEKYLRQVLGVDANTAATVAFKPKTGNPNADHANVFKAVLSSTLGDEDKAKRAADQYVLDQYGAGAIGKANAPLIPNNPPPQAIAGLKPGMVRDFGANGKWTVGIDGKPVRVGTGSASIQ